MFFSWQCKRYNGTLDCIDFKCEAVARACLESTSSLYHVD